MLAVKGLDVYYGDVQALNAISFDVHEGEMVALIGANGAGKTTLLRTISGLLRPRRGEIFFAGPRIDHAAPHHIVAAGLAHVPEGRKLFPEMMVLENLEIGAMTPRAKANRRATLETVFSMFPRLAERKTQKAGTLSGGEQQMLALGRALMAQPRMLLLDEPSQGLAPLIVEQIFHVVETINREKQMAILIVEQNVTRTLKMVHRGYVIENGRIVLEGESAALLVNPDVKKAYLGL